MQNHFAEEQSTSDQKSANILLIDDEADILFILKRSLELKGIKSYGFTNPILAIDHFKKNPTAYDLVISDIRMPGKNGFEVTRSIKKINPNVRIVLMTAFEVNKSELEKVLPSLKVDDLMTKPIKPNEFVQRIANICSSAKKPAHE